MQCFAQAGVPSMLPFLHMQTVGSGFTEDAKSTTREEFTDNMKILVAMARQQLGALGLQPLFSYDNNKIQATASLYQMGLSRGEKVPLARYMPDGHRVIENVFAWLKPAVHKSLYGGGRLAIGAVTPAEAREVVHNCFKAYPTAAVQKNVHDLPVTYHVISQPRDSYTQGPDGLFHIGTGGDWTPKEYR